ncbi:MAG: prolyl-tRNA synthetase [Verrucomicrobiales bacterium]|nr:prolyl-tRNA synthetase [Verrucomicrobiales bacterium]
MPSTRVKNFLEKENVCYSTILHSPAFTAQESSESAHISGKAFAKTVIVEIDGKSAMAVLPADRRVDLDDLREITGSSSAHMASEAQMKSLFPDCEIGAMPPLGNLYGMEVYVAPALAQSGEIVFNAGSHTELIKMRFADFERVAQPRILSFTM